jgi:uncharacterized protein YndB with AHSA1/START domain
MDRGTYVGYDGKPAVRFERNYPYPIDRLWRAITEPKELARWFPSGVAHEGKVGGTITFDGDPYSDPSAGTILAFVRPRAVSFTWGEDVLHFTLEAVGEHCRLVLINVLAEAEAAARNAAGWTICLSELDKWLAGAASGGPHDRGAEASFELLLEQYVADGMPTGAVIPDRKAQS